MKNQVNSLIAVPDNRAISGWFITVGYSGEEEAKVKNEIRKEIRKIERILVNINKKLEERKEESNG